MSMTREEILRKIHELEGQRDEFYRSASSYHEEAETIRSNSFGGNYYDDPERWDNIAHQMNQNAHQCSMQIEQLRNLLK